MHAVISSFLLAAALAASPFPAPIASPVSEDLKFTSGLVLTVDVTAGTAVVKTAAGPVKFDLKQAKIIGADKNPTTLSAVPGGQQVSIYFRINGGAVVQEMDL